MGNKKAVILFVKYPLPGKVKTRLAFATSDIFAFEIYKILSERIFSVIVLLEKEIDKYLFYSNTDDPQEVKYWVKKDFVYIRQKGSDLGERMKNAFGELYDRKYEKVLIIGSDVPDISKSFIENAFESLSLSNVVISPSDDGGYSLLGTDNFYPGLFSDIRWSTNSVLEKTIEIVKSLNLNMLLLPHLNDIDTVTELSKWLEKSNESSMAKKINTIAERENIKLLSKN